MPPLRNRVSHSARGACIIKLALLIFTTAKISHKTGFYDGPRYLSTLQEIISTHPRDGRTLVIVNDTNRRFVLSTAALLNDSCDLAVFRHAPERVEVPENNPYNRLIWIDCKNAIQNNVPDINQLNNLKTEFTLIEGEPTSDPCIWIWKKNQ